MPNGFSVRSGKLGNGLTYYIRYSEKSRGKRSTTAFADAVYIQPQMQYIFNRRCSIYSTADAVYIQPQMQYIFNRRCSIYSFFRDMYWLLYGHPFIVLMNILKMPVDKRNQKELCLRRELKANSTEVLASNSLFSDFVTVSPKNSASASSLP